MPLFLFCREHNFVVELFGGKVADVAELADAQGLGPCAPKGACGFDSRHPHKQINRLNGETRISPC